jgi:hypothetical protein
MLTNLGSCSIDHVTYLQYALEHSDSGAHPATVGATEPSMQELDDDMAHIE